MSVSICVCTAVSCISPPLFIPIYLYSCISYPYFYLLISIYTCIPKSIYLCLYICTFRSLSAVSVYFYISISPCLYPYLLLYNLCRYLEGDGTKLPRFYFQCNSHNFLEVFSPPRPAILPLFAGEFWKSRKRKKTLGELQLCQRLAWGVHSVSITSLLVYPGSPGGFPSRELDPGFRCSPRRRDNEFERIMIFFVLFPGPLRGPPSVGSSPEGGGPGRAGRGGGGAIDGG